MVRKTENLPVMLNFQTCVENSAKKYLKTNSKINSFDRSSHRNRSDFEKKTNSKIKDFERSSLRNTSDLEKSDVRIDCKKKSEVLRIYPKLLLHEKTNILNSLQIKFQVSGGDGKKNKDSDFDRIDDQDSYGLFVDADHLKSIEVRKHWINIKVNKNFFKQNHSMRKIEILLPKCQLIFIILRF